MQLFERAAIGNLQLSNRIIMAPMGTKSEPDGGFSARTIRYYEERARHGVGMIITGRCATQDKYEMRSHHLLTNYHHINRLALLAEKVHIHGTALCVQIGPGLGRIVHQDPCTPPYSASAVPSFWYPHLTCRPLTESDIGFLAQSVGNAAALARQAGADAVELHAYGGYLLDQFHCALWNHRQDAYGGGLAGRMKFTLECIAAIQSRCGRDFPLIVKYSAEHQIPGGITPEEGVEMARRFEAAGVHALHVDVGCYEKWYQLIPTVYQEPGYQLPTARRIRQAVGIPVIAHGKLGQPGWASRALEDGSADFAALGHALLADPAWPAKARAGRWADIRPCIGCNECLRRSHLGMEHSCAVNPQALREEDYPLCSAREKKRVLVIGGGPGGCAAALAAASRGHRVSLWERGERLGGALLAAGAPDFKRDVSAYADWLARQVGQADIETRLRFRATPEAVAGGAFDRVILAAGARPLRPALPWAEAPNVRQVLDILLGRAEAPGRVVILGGGLAACETALHLHRLGQAVTILIRGEDILRRAEHCRNNDMKLRDMLRARQIPILCGAAVAEISPGQIHYIQAGAVHQLACDTVLLAFGLESRRELAEALTGQFSPEHLAVIGDARQPGNIFRAVQEGFHAGRLA